MCNREISEHATDSNSNNELEVTRNACVLTTGCTMLLLLISFQTDKIKYLGAKEQNRGTKEEIENIST